ncbi:hypothetical protein MUB04_15885 [Acinetobacter indicus]|uniref:hypothetical protein n=1 Tax=Acinetobacter TaxID=469 RepID=UPI0015D18E1E|nr:MULTISPECIES: hypothetical protein [Acinetobacter]MCP0918019.1 hypothetical protein [Acinetobacter indicus]
MQKLSPVGILSLEQNLFTFDRLTTVACQIFPITPQQVREAALSLYDKSMISYPLTTGTVAYSHQKEDIQNVLLHCSKSEALPLFFMSNQALEKFYKNADSIFLKDERASLLGAVSGILTIGFPTNIDYLSELEYAIYILVLVQVKCWLIQAAPLKELNDYFAQLSFVKNNRQLGNKRRLTTLNLKWQ